MLGSKMSESIDRLPRLHNHYVERKTRPSFTKGLAIWRKMRLVDSRNLWTVSLMRSRTQCSYFITTIATCRWPTAREPCIQLAGFHNTLPISCRFYNALCKGAALASARGSGRSIREPLTHGWRIGPQLANTDRGRVTPVAPPCGCSHGRPRDLDDQWKKPLDFCAFQQKNSTRQQGKPLCPRSRLDLP